MKFLWLYIGAFLILPIVGEIIIFKSDEVLSAGSVSVELIIHNIIFVIIVLIVAYSISNYNIIKSKYILIYNCNYLKKVFNRSIFLFFSISIIIFLLGGYKILFHLADRGEVRASLGSFGMLYTLLLNYLPIAIILFISVIYMHLDYYTKKIFKSKLLIIFLFSIVLGLLSGYKAVAVMIMIPGFIVLFFNNFNLKKLLIFITFVIIILTLFTSIVRDMTIIDAFSFLLHRMTVMTAYGTIGVWNVYPNGAESINDIFMNFLGVFGEKISSYLTGLSPNNPDFLKTNLSRLITYKVYPDVDRALANSVNVTVTNFGHALYIFGKTFYIYYALIIGGVIGIAVRLFKNSVLLGNAFSTSIVGTYLFMVILPSINSGGIFMLFSLPVFIYFILVYLIMKYLIESEIRFV